MVAWQAIPSWANGDVIDEDDMGIIKGDLEYLLTPNAELYTNFDGSTQYTTTSTVWADVDSTNMRHTIVTNGGDVFVEVGGWGVWSTATYEVCIDIEVDGARLSGQTYGLFLTGAGELYRTMRISGLAAGSHTLALQFRMATAGGTARFRNYSSVIGECVVPLVFNVSEGL